MIDIFVPCIFRGKTPILLKTAINNGTIKKESWELPNIDYHVENKTSEYENIFRKIEKYFTGTFENAENKEIEILLDEKYENLFKDVKISLNQDNTSMLLGIFLAAAKEIMKLDFKEDWYSITATGTFKNLESGLELEEIGDYKPMPEKPDKYTGFLNYVKENEDTNENKCPPDKQYLYLYINEDKEFAYETNTENESNIINNIQVKGFSPTTDTLFDILDFVFILPTLPKNLLDGKTNSFFDDFDNETQYIRKEEHIESPIYRDKKLTEKLDRNSLFIYGPHGSGRSYLAFQLAQVQIWNRNNYIPIWINMDNESSDSPGEYYMGMKIKLLSVFINNQVDIKAKKNEDHLIKILDEKQFLVIIDGMDLKEEVLDGFFDRVKETLKIIAERKDGSRFIFINSTKYSKKINYLEFYPMRLYKPGEENEERKAVIKFFHKISERKTYYNQNVEKMKEYDVLYKYEEGAYNTYKGFSFSIDPLIKWSDVYFSSPYPWDQDDKSVRVTFKDDNTILVSFSLDVETYAVPKSVIIITDFTFDGCKYLKHISIPDSVTNIGIGTFRDCINLKHITIPKLITTIGDSVFKDCKSLEYVTIPDLVTNIGREAFRNCISLKHITIPKLVTTIGSYAFFDCNSLESVTIPEKVTYIGRCAFHDCCNLKGITIPKSITAIESYTFYGCSSLESVNIPGKVEIIGHFAFSRCSSLENVIIPESVITIGDFAFSCCSSLESVNIPESVITIEDFAFSRCSSLKNVNIPKSVKKINLGAFKWCSKLTTVNIPRGTIVAEDAFDEHVQKQYI